MEVLALIGLLWSATWGCLWLNELRCSVEPGYEGEESIYLTKAVLDAAYNDSGLALDFYKSYNPEFHNPGKQLGVKIAWGARLDLISRYFSTLVSIPTSEMEACSSSEFSNSGRMQMYKDFSGDAAGAGTRGPGLSRTCTALKKQRPWCQASSTGRTGWWRTASMAARAVRRCGSMIAGHA